MKIFAAVLLAALMATAVVAADLEPLAGPPFEGRATTLTFTHEGLPAADVGVTATYRQGAHEVLQHDQNIGKTDAAGLLAWTPEEAGVVVLAWDGGARNVSVLHDGIQPGAIVVGAFAGLLLLGGSVFFFRKMLKGGAAEFAREHGAGGEPPST